MKNFTILAFSMLLLLNMAAVGAPEHAAKIKSRSPIVSNVPTLKHTTSHPPTEHKGPNVKSGKGG